MTICEICKERKAVVFSEYAVCLACYDAMQDVEKEEEEHDSLISSQNES